jgi:polyphosphate kinase 2
MPKKVKLNARQLAIPDTIIPDEIYEKMRSAKNKDIISSNYPYKKKMKRAEYEAKKQDLQVELLKVQHWVKETGQRIILIFEGRDAAGKGGAIKRFMEHLNPRGARVVALNKPSEEERGQWYFQRYFAHLPTKGELVFFDRSWYNRAVVEPVMGFCSDTEHHRFLREAPQLENMLVNNDFYLFKFWFSVSREEQLRRFKSREQDELKQWKLSIVDIESLNHWDAYTKVKKDMFLATDTKLAPWTVVRSDDKKRARLNCMRYVLQNLPYPEKNQALLSELDAKIIGPKEDMYEGDDW